MDKNRIRKERAKRQEELSKQEELIARKKLEILERLNTKNASNDLSVKTAVKSEISIDINPPASSSKTVAASQIETCQIKVKNEPVERPSELTTGSLPHKPIKISLPVINKFKNDGSFLEQFKSLQNSSNKKKEESKCKKIDVSAVKQESSFGVRTDPNNYQAPDEKSTTDATEIKYESHDLTSESRQSSSISTIGHFLKGTSKQYATTDYKQKPLSGYRVPDSQKEKRDISSSNSSASHRQPSTSTIEKEIDNALRLVRQESSRNMSFKSNTKATSQSISQTVCLDPPAPGSSSALHDATIMSYDKMRWSSERTVDASKDAALCQYARQVFGTTDLSTDQWKQLEDQRKMKALFEVIQQRFDIQPQKSMITGKTDKDDKRKDKKHKYAYDSDEEIDPNEGTWEHKKRRKEMEKTKNWAQSLTEMNKGKHHLGDYLPPQELEKFMKKWESIQTGNISQLSKSDYDDFKIQCDNLGYKMMLKLGWKEGQGLGAGETAQTSIKEPIKATSNYNGAGLGSSDPTELNEGDDIYEAYRKRMMLAYRFRPNPLNNPRRPYY